MAPIQVTAAALVDAVASGLVTGLIIQQVVVLADIQALVAQALVEAQVVVVDRTQLLIVVAAVGVVTPIQGLVLPAG